MSDETLRVATVARAQLGMANFLAIADSDLDFIVTDELEQSLTQAEAALEETTRGLEQLIEVGGASRHGWRRPTTSSSPSGRTMLGVDRGRARRRSHASLPRPNSTRHMRRCSRELLIERDRQLEQVSSSDRFMAKLGDVARFLVALLIPLAVIVVYREIVRRQQRQAELEVRLAAEKEVGKARDDFVANASHEFRTPLTSIYGLSQLIEEDESTPTETRELAAMISSEAGDLSRMVEDLLTTARLEAGALTFHAEQVMTHQDIGEVVQPFLSAGAAIDVRVKPAVVRVDRLRQRQVLRNLLSNAGKYGGPDVRVVGERDGAWYVWTVSDDGDGIPEELEANLFERFIHQGTTVVISGRSRARPVDRQGARRGHGGNRRYARRDGTQRVRSQGSSRHSGVSGCHDAFAPVTARPAAAASRWPHRIRTTGTVDLGGPEGTRS